MQRGFTLVELAIVLVIIGLIVGGVLVGRDLISAAAIRAQTTQYAKFDAAANTFQSKYSGLPGDLFVNRATEYGFSVGSCTGGVGTRDGNGIIEEGFATPYHQGFREVQLFWSDLASAMLVPGGFPANGAIDRGCTTTANANLAPGATYIGNYLPTAAIGQQNFLYVNSWKGRNWYGISAMTSMTATCATSTEGLKVIQAYSIDEKLDDGLPQSGTVQAAFVTCTTSVKVASFAASASANTCYDTGSGKYSTKQNDGEGLNCALMVRMQ